MLFYNNMFKMYRAKKELTLEEVGNFVGVSKQTVQKWESGIVKPRPRYVYKIAELFNISVVDISDLKAEEWLIKNSTIGDNNTIGNNTIINTTTNLEQYKSRLIQEIIMLDIDTQAKDLVLRTISSFKG